jgi:hypothetical protein
MRIDAKGRSMNTRITLTRLLLAAALAAVLSGCATIRNGMQLEAGPGLQFDAKELAQYRESQDKVLAELVKLTVEPNASAPTTHWDEVIAAGMDYADGKCEAYMHALFRLNRDRRTTTSQIGLLGTASAGVMAAAKSAAKDVAIVAIAFGLASATVDNLSSNLLYELEPSSVRAMVQTLQATYRQQLGVGYLTRPAAATAIRRYAVLCLPASIEAEVNLSVKKAEPGTVKSDPAKGQPPSVTNGVTITSDQLFRPDDSTAVLEQFLSPNGTGSEANRRKLEAFMESRGLPKTSVVSFINGAGFAAERVNAIKFLGLKK